MRSAQRVQGSLFLAIVMPFLAASARTAATEVADGQPLEVKVPNKADSRQFNIYTFFELIQHSERIVVADVDKNKDGDVILNVKQVLKAPAQPKKLDPDAVKRAAERLEHPNVEIPAAPSKPAPAAAPTPETISVVVERTVPLPPEGTQAVFFLWERTNEGVYRIAHPQCIYDADLLPQIRLGVNRPHAVADGRYLREWDKQMAQRARQREADRALDLLKGGEVIMGLRLLALRPQISVRRDNSFSITAKIENVHKKDQAIYDGPAGGFAIRMRPKNGGPAVVLHRSVQTSVAGVDNAVLSITDVMDFSTVPRESSLTKDLFFDSRLYPALLKLDGEYLVSTVYSSAFDGAGLDVGSAVWTGTLISEEATITFTTQSKTEADPADSADKGAKESSRK
jgi:hypothetical protein